MKNKAVSLNVGLDGKFPSLLPIEQLLAGVCISLEANR